jgi:hypothetical protein
MGRHEDLLSSASSFPDPDNIAGRINIDLIQASGFELFF